MPAAVHCWCKCFDQNQLPWSAHCVLQAVYHACMGCMVACLEEATRVVADYVNGYWRISAIMTITTTGCKALTLTDSQTL